MEKQTFIERGDGYLLMYNVGVDNSFRTEFFATRDEAITKAKEYKDQEYIGLNGIQEVKDYWEWVF